MPSWVVHGVVHACRSWRQTSAWQPRGRRQERVLGRKVPCSPLSSGGAQVVDGRSHFRHSIVTRPKSAGSWSGWLEKARRSRDSQLRRVAEDPSLSFEVTANVDHRGGFGVGSLNLV